MSPPQSAYQIDNFDHLPDEELVCSICCCVFSDPVECPCHHVFCQTCIKSWLSQKKNCPICREWMNIESLRPVVPIIKNMILKLKMKCPNTAHGCKEKITLERYEMHLASCLYEQIECSNKDCKEKLIRKDVSQHEQKECEYRLVQCNRDCQLQIPWCLLKHHNCLEELRKHLLEKEKTEKKLKKQISEQEEELKCLHQELEQLRSVNHQSSDGEVEEFESYYSDDLSSAQFSDIFNDSLELSSNSFNISDYSNQTQNSNNQASQHLQTLETTVSTMTTIPSLPQINLQVEHRDVPHTEEILNHSFRGKSSLIQGESGCSYEESYVVERIDLNGSLSSEHREEEQSLTVTDIQNTFTCSDNENRDHSQNISLSTELENDDVSSDEIPFTRRHILKRKIPAPVLSDDENDSMIQMVFKNNRTEFVGKRDKNSLGATIANSLGEHSGLNTRVSAERIFSSNLSEACDSQNSISVGQNNEENETVTQLSESEEPQPISSCEHRDHQEQERTSLQDPDVDGLTDYQEQERTLQDVDVVDGTLHIETDCDSNTYAGTRQRTTLNNDALQPVNEMDDQHHQGNSCVEVATQITLGSNSLRTRRMHSSQRNRQNIHSISSGLPRTLALLERYSAETDPDWEPPLQVLQNEQNNEENVIVRRSNRMLSGLLEEFIESEEDDSDWEPERWADVSSDSTSEEWESDSSYEVKVPPRTWDLLEQYSKDDSSADSDWNPTV